MRCDLRGHRRSPRSSGVTVGLRGGYRYGGNWQCHEVIAQKQVPKGTERKQSALIARYSSIRPGEYKRSDGLLDSLTQETLRSGL